MKQQITKNAIETAFLKLLKERNFEKVMVKDIVEECGLTRNTFYYYYDDTYHIVEDILEREVLRILDEMKHGTPFLKSLEDVLEYLDENPKIARHLFTSAKKDDMYRYVRSTAEILLRQSIEISAKDAVISEQDKTTIVNTCKYVFQGMIEEWIENNCRTSLKAEAENVWRLFDAVLLSAVKNANRT